MLRWQIRRVDVAFYAAGAVLIAAYLTWRIGGLGTWSFWFDEVFSIQATHGTLADNLGYIRNDAIHPPLYYLLLKAWLSLRPETEAWARLLTLLFLVAAAVATASIVRLSGGSRLATIVCLAAVICNEYLIQYSEYVRMYGLLAMSAALSVWLVVWLTLHPRANGVITALLTVSFVLLVYTHYFGWLLIFAFVVIAIASHRDLLPRLLRASAITGLLFLPWAAYVSAPIMERGGVQSNVGWIPRPGLANLVWFGHELVGQTGVNVLNKAALVIVSAVLAAWWYGAARRVRTGAGTPRARIALLLLATTVLPVITCWVAAQFLPQSSWQSKYLIIVAPSFFIALCLALDDLKPHVLRIASFAALFAWVAAALATGPAPYGHQPDYRGLVQTICPAWATPCANLRLVTNEEFLALPLRYYGADSLDVIVEPDVARKAWKASGWVVVRVSENLTSRVGFAGLSPSCEVRTQVDTASRDYVVRLMRIECGEASVASGPAEPQATGGFWQ